VTVKLLDADKVIATSTGVANTPLVMTVPNIQLWGPGSPKLYNISIQLADDVVLAYTGFRTVEKGVVKGVTRALLNGEILFAFGPLECVGWGRLCFGSIYTY
jgi:beta-galactosidase/beta-glucuronidase